MTIYQDIKPHYHILDGLHGVATIMVLCYHLFEAFATSHIDQTINHGSITVDFFFILSGFVVSHAYDDCRWKTKSIKNFLKRRVIRLHPMVVLSAILGANMFCNQGCSIWDVPLISSDSLILATIMIILLVSASRHE